MWTSVIVFSATYVLIAARRLRLLPIGRPAGALLGATAMVALGVLSPAQAYASIDHDTIVLLFGMMLLTAELDGGFFDRFADRLAAVARTPQTLLAGVVLASGLASAVLVNDTICLLFTPAVVRLCVRHRLPTGAFLIALATSANIGSAATLVGNPQNMLIGSMSGIPFSTFLVAMAPATVVGLAANLGMLLFAYRRPLAAATLALGAETGPTATSTTQGSWLSWIVPVAMVGVLAAFLSGAHLGFSTLTGALFVLIVGRTDPRDAFARVDWTLLVFFCALFVVVHGFASTGLVDAAWGAVRPSVDTGSVGGVGALAAGVVIGSNIVSNVPLVMLVGEHVGGLGEDGAGWYLLAWSSTVAGNLTLLGSVANLIVAERARDHYELGFLEYLRFGAASTLVVVALGAAVLLALH